MPYSRCGCQIRWSIALPRSVLDTLNKLRLVEISRELGVVVKTSATKEAQIAALSRKMNASLPQILRALGRDELKLACREHGLDDRGRSREELWRRILAACTAASEVPAASSGVVFRPLPDQGDLVVVRQRQYLVTEVTSAAAEGTMTRVRLVCLDDDAQGRPSEVLWELELGARILDAKPSGRRRLPG